MSDFAQQKNVHYFPGHMKKALVALMPLIKCSDVVVEVCDARIPLSSRNPLLNQAALSNKPRLLLLSKTDRADPRITEEWLHFFNEKGLFCISANLKGERILSVLDKALMPLVKKKREKEQKYGMKKQPLRLLILGIPNVGKSTLINNLGGRKLAIVANRPGVTRAPQWIRLSDSYLLLDTPGILPMNYEDKVVAKRLAMVGSIKEEVLPIHDLAEELLGFLEKEYPSSLEKRYLISLCKNGTFSEFFKKIAANRGYLLEGGQEDINKAMLAFLKDFQNGELGPLSLERPLC